MNTLKHDDCKNLATIDVTKGYCHLHKRLVAIDSLVCDEFLALPKCGICANFLSDKTEKYMGVCTAGKKHPWTYQDLIVENCEMYKEK
ncbi:MAG: 4-hydroxyphenylacetate decarboxylase small subunit [Acidaminococcales bacterium]|nr:4-hydroxyphenylacetate decarboxylase small subunit [Acidaminococcales bacterium]